MDGKPAIASPRRVLRSVRALGASGPADVLDERRELRAPSRARTSAGLRRLHLRRLRRCTRLRTGAARYPVRHLPTPSPRGSARFTLRLFASAVALSRCRGCRATGEGQRQSLGLRQVRVRPSRSPRPLLPGVRRNTRAGGSRATGLMNAALRTRSSWRSGECGGGRARRSATSRRERSRADATWRPSRRSPDSA